MMPNSEHIPVFLSSDNNYAPFVATTICSIMDNTKSFVDFYVLDGGISETNKKKIRSIDQQFPNFSIEFIKIDTQKEFKDFPTRLHFTIDMYTRYLIPQLKPHLKKVIYSDVDVIFNGDIEDLYGEDLNNYIIGAVPYTFGYLNPDKKEIESYHKRLKLSSDHQYFESGLLLIDNILWRKNDTTNKLLKKAKECKKTILTPDQDVLNLIFENNYQRLGNKYIVVPHRAKIMLANIQTRESVENPIIFHFAGSSSNKPWNNPNIAYADHFWKYAKRTPFYEGLISSLAEKIQQENIKGASKRQDASNLKKISAKIKFAFFSPRRFFIKYWNRFF
ncbi:MAG: glycosyltransferase family 8 protein [Candidatus Moranbacteria bacterium]|nr:glycosyltransferase family 8 protein [Candidatus Moranbacteria bacterium]